MKKIITFRKINRDEKIAPSDFQSYGEDGPFLPIVNKETISQTPDFFSENRCFWRMIENESVE